jgi:hypothetical protein
MLCYVLDLACCVHSVMISKTSFAARLFVLANLETVLADDGASIEKSVLLRAPREQAHYLHDSGIDLVNLANNHALDYGASGFESTISAVESAGIGYIGVIRHGKQRPYVFNTDTGSIGVLGYTIAAGSNTSLGVAPLDRALILDELAELKRRTIDRVIINLHWGEEYVAYPSPAQQKLARELIDQGADVIVGHHPHVVQGVEQYKGGVIFYSLGNFNFQNSSNVDRLFPGTRWGLIALLRFPKGLPVQHECRSVWIDDEYRPAFPPQKERDAFTAYVKCISSFLEEGISQAFWLREASWPRFRNNMSSFVFRIRKYGIRHFYQMVRWLVGRHSLAYYWGLFLRIMPLFVFNKSSTGCNIPRHDDAN